MTGILIRNASIVDGTGSREFRGSILVRDGRVAEVGNLVGATANTVIDATGLTAAPGFIDTHVHTDMTLLDESVHECLLHQGITTVIMGQDGLSYAPLSNANQAMFRRYLKGLNGNATNPAPWGSVAEYRALFDRTVCLNTAYALPHAALRLETVGFHNRPLVGEDLTTTKKLLEQGLAEGACAFSTGLSYFPGTYADTDELVSLGEVAAAAGRPYVTHLRSVFERPQPDWILAGLREAMTIGRRSGVAVHVSHFGPKPWRYDTPATMLQPVDQAKADGVNVTLEVYPYPSGNTYLLIHLPPWAHEGGPEAILELIRSGRHRQRLVDEIESNTIAPFGCQIGYVAGEHNQHLVGKRVDDVAAARGVRVGEAVLQLLDETDLAIGAREGLPTMPGFWDKHRDQLMQVLDRGDYMIGSDAIPVAQLPHPRTYGTFPRVLRFARETGALSLPQVVHLMTELPARTFGLTDRGVLRRGAYADIVLFNPDAITDHATYEQPAQLSTGVQHLMINGQFVIRDNVTTGRLAGQPV